MDDEREQEIRAYVSGQSPELAAQSRTVYLLEELDLAREENGRLRAQVTWLYERIAETMDGERFQAFVERQNKPALARVASDA